MRESLWLASAVLCVILIILIVSYKLVLRRLGVMGRFVKAMEWMDLKGIGTRGGRTVFLRAGEPVPAWGPLPEHDHRA